MFLEFYRVLLVIEIILAKIACLFLYNVNGGARLQ